MSLCVTGMTPYVLMRQGSSGTGAATGTGSGLRTARPSYSESNAAPSGGGGGGRAPYSSTAGPTSSYGGGGGAGGGTRGGGGGGGGGAFDSGTAGRDMSYGLAARCAAILSRLPAFPPPQRPFVFFLEAADSHLLLTAVARCMAGVLQVRAHYACLHCWVEYGSASPRATPWYTRGTCAADSPSV